MLFQSGVNECVLQVHQQLLRISIPVPTTIQNIKTLKPSKFRK
jgi:hypothetical protein